ncbi:McrC family protein [Aquimonas sp.]|jgi:5-methylcytosine-specific restriction enzyme subunit McrC|uniref:McrC family protein n=1 Tax=Aquimonas sp. TaxID=1872588 RepID=UPI0037BF93C9
MKPLTIFEFDTLVEAKAGVVGPAVPQRVFAWLDMQALRNDSSGWLKPTQRNGARAVQVTRYVGVIRAPCGFHIEVLPKTGRNTSRDEARALLLRMLKCLAGFRHIKTADADLASERMPLLEVFIQQFLLAVGALVKRGLRSDYVARQDNLFALRGRLVIAKQVSQNLTRRDRFFTEHDEFSQNRAENRLIHTALRQVLSLCRSQENQRAARELGFVFADVPLSIDVGLDIQRIRLDRGMRYYSPALDWAKLILKGLSPISGVGKQDAPSLLFPMNEVFEAYVEKHLPRQLRADFVLKGQASSQHLVAHDAQRWFRMKPDLLVKQKHTTRLILDAKWKLLDAAKKNGREKYQLSQADFYQLYAYGHHYLDGAGDIVLIYPKTDAFTAPLPVFEFPKSSGMRLWVLPFCLDRQRLEIPPCLEAEAIFA